MKLHPFTTHVLLDASLCTCAKGVQFYCPSHTYTAIPHCTIFPIFNPLLCKDLSWRKMNFLIWWPKMSTIQSKFVEGYFLWINCLKIPKEKFNGKNFFKCWFKKIIENKYVLFVLCLVIKENKHKHNFLRHNFNIQINSLKKTTI